MIRPLALLALLVAVFVLVTAMATAHDDDVPPLREWQAKRVAYGYAIAGDRPLYVVTGTARRSRHRVAVTAREPGSGPADTLEPDVTVTLVERRGFQFWVRDPFTGGWSRWL